MSWACFNEDITSMVNVAPYASRGAPHVSIDGDGRLVMYSDDGVATQVLIPLAIGQQFSMELEFRPTQIPMNLDNLANYAMFIGGYDRQDNAGGVLISKLGLALVSTLGAAAVPIPGSQNIFTEGETSHTLRLVVDGVTNLMHVYVTQTDMVPVTGHVLRYTSAAPTTAEGTTDHVLIWIMGQSADITELKLGAIRVDCAAALIPNARPIADPGADQTATLFASVVHDGRNSYDPEGLPVSYDWALVDCPDGSRYKQTGLYGNTIDDGDGDGFTQVFDAGGTAFSLANMPLLQPGDHLVVGGYVYEVSTTRWAASGAAWVRDAGAGWVNHQIVVTKEAIPDSFANVPWVLLHSDTYFSDREQSYPSGLPDKAGIYQTQLIVNDGVLDSLARTSYLNVTDTGVPLGIVPNVGWIWNHLPDFWRQFEDRDQVETLWTGMARSLADMLMYAWQVDRNKSLATVQRVFQRRWLNYSTRTASDPDEAGLHLIRGPIYSQDLIAGVVVAADKTLILSLDGADWVTITVPASGVPYIASDIAALINAGLGLDSTATPLATAVTSGGAEYVLLTWPTLVEVKSTGTLNVDMGWSTTANISNDVAGMYGRALDASTLRGFITTDLVNLDPPILSFPSLGIGPDSLLLYGSEAYNIQAVSEHPVGIPGAGQARGLGLTTDLPDTAARPWSVPSTVRSATDFDEEYVLAGDLAIFEVLQLSTSTTSEVLCTILGVKGDLIAFEPVPLYQAYAGNPSDYHTSFQGVVRTSRIPVDMLVKSVPQLQEVLQDPPSVLTENADYTIEPLLSVKSITFRAGTFSITNPPPETLWAELTYLDNRYNIQDNFGRMVNFEVENLEQATDDLDYLSAVRGLWWAYFSGPVIDQSRTASQILLGLPFVEVDSVVEEIDPLYSATLGRIVMSDKENPAILRTYLYPLLGELAGSRTHAGPIAVGDVLPQFFPLCGGVEIADWISTPKWFQDFISVGEFLEVEKYANWLIRADVDIFNLKNLMFAIEFARNISPEYAAPMFVILKKVSDEIDLLDDTTLLVNMQRYDNLCSLGPGTWRWDETDGSGNPVHAYDTTPYFLYDRLSLCPAESIYIVMGYTHAAGPWPYDSIWAYDNGDLDGDTISDDPLPLSGPSATLPLPGAIEIGPIQMDAGMGTAMLVPPVVYAGPVVPTLPIIAPGKYWRAPHL